MPFVGKDELSGLSVSDVLSLSRLLDVESSRLDVELLLCYVLEKSRSWIYSWPEVMLTECQKIKFNELFSRRCGGEPVAYIIGEREFWSLSLQVNPSTLIPRPDTELLIELALSMLPESDVRVLDLGTGTGAIALALASEKALWHLTGVDISADAILLAQTNADTLSLPVRFLTSDWFTAIKDSLFNLIVSNPPYIASNDAHLAEGDVRFEPKAALVSGEEGLEDLRKIIQQSPDYLKDQGWLMLEHGWKQAPHVRRLMSARGFLSVSSHRDLSRHERVTIGKWARVSTLIGR